MKIETQEPIKPVSVKEEWVLRRTERFGPDKFIDHELDHFFEKAARDPNKPEGANTFWYLVEDLIRNGQDEMAARVLFQLPFRSVEELVRPMGVAKGMGVIENLPKIIRTWMRPELIDDETAIKKRGYSSMSREQIEELKREMIQDRIEEFFRFRQHPNLLYPFDRDSQPTKELSHRHFTFSHEFWSVNFHFSQPDKYPEPDSYLMQSRLDEFRRQQIVKR